MLKKILGPAATVVNGVVVWLAGAPVIGPLVSKQIVSISYVGRKSGKTFTTPVAYRRTGNEVAIPVSMPDAKTWWRNFSGTGAPITLQFDDGDRTGHAVSSRDERGRVSVAVRLDP